MSLIREQIVKRTTRSNGWRKVRKKHIKKHRICAACGRTRSLEVHHVEDFSENPELELDPDNLLTLCDAGTKCHFSLGHLGNWKSINPDILKDAAWYLDKIKNRR